MGQEAARAEALLVEGVCPECGAPFSAGIWDRSHLCEYCGSLLALPHAGGERVYVVGQPGGITALDLLIHYELTLLEARLSQRSTSEEELRIEFPAWIEARLRARERELRDSTELLLEADFFAPYEVREETVLWGVLGRRGEGPKLSFTHSSCLQRLRRRYDPARYSLRDRGLKIHALRLRPLAGEDMERVSRRCLPLIPAGVEPDRRDFTPAPDTELRIVRGFSERWRPRALTVLKHLTYVHVRLDGTPQHLLLDRQFHTLAARLRPDEAERFRAVPPLALERLLGSERPAALASECPDCGAPLRIEPREIVTFCGACLRAVEVSPKSLRSRPCRYPPPPSGSFLYFPFWSFPFDVGVGGVRYRNLWRWLEAVSPEQRVRRFQQNDPPESRLLVPARTLRGSAALDRAAELVTGYANWCQPSLSLDRPTPGGGPAPLGADVSAQEAAALRRFALLSLHDARSTRGLHAANFRSFIEEAALGACEPELALVALPLEGGLFWLADQGEGVAPGTLRSGLDRARGVRSFPLD